jgi:fluoride ion exporter CrcB/FEX
MMGRGEMSKACSYLLVNNVGGVAAACTGMMVAKKLFKV